MYHSIKETSPYFATVPPAEFRRQLRYLQEYGHQFISIEQAAAFYYSQKALPERAVCVTFDDGYQDNLLNALPILEECQCPAVIYVVSDFVKQRKSQRNLPICSMAELQELARHPLITIGGHTRSHPKLSKLPYQQAREEILSGKQQLEDWIGQSVRHFAYPYGAYTEQTIDIVREAEFRTSVTVIPEYIGLHDDPFRIGRIPVDKSVPFDIFPLCCTETMTHYANMQRSFSRIIAGGV